jgi:thiamine biosynthesis lipoprotein
MPERGHHRVEHAMGTAISVDVRDPEVQADALDAVFDWFRWVDEVFTTYQPASQICRLGRGELSVAECDPLVGRVLDRCAEMQHLTNGYFDIWATGSLDPSGLVKGWSVEEASRILAERGSPNHCINAGGDIRLRGEPERGRPWRAGIAHPHIHHGVTVIVEGRDLAVATSGIAERGLHVRDPHTGRAAIDLASVTVVGADLTIADSFATAALAMGRHAPDWLEALDDHEAYVIDAGGHVWWTRGFPGYAPALQPAASPR